MISLRGVLSGARVKFCSRGSFAARLLILAVLILTRSVCAATPGSHLRKQRLPSCTDSSTVLTGRVLSPRFITTMAVSGGRAASLRSQRCSTPGYVVFVPHRRGQVLLRPVSWIGSAQAVQRQQRWSSCSRTKRRCYRGTAISGSSRPLTPRASQSRVLVRRYTGRPPSVVRLAAVAFAAER